jgi:hypothetical protein
MLSSIFIALLQAVAGDPAVNATEAPAAETTVPVTTAAPAAPRTERRRVCEAHPAATGGRLQARRCRWEEVPVVEETAPEAEAEDHSNHQAGGHAGTAPAPAPATTPNQN